MKKILILSSSPQRDKLIDSLLKKELERLGNEVHIRSIGADESMTRGGSVAVMELEPDVLVVPPVRNVNAFLLCEASARWGVGVVIRHVEPSCDSKDIDFMGDIWKQCVLYERPEGVLFELMWGKQEADFVRKALAGTARPISVGAFVADAYKNPAIIEKLKDKDVFCRKYGLNQAKKTVLVSSPWGLLDMESDIKGQTADAMLSDKEAQAAWLGMVKDLKATIDEKWNIITTIHPGLMRLESFRESLKELNIPLDSKSMAIELLTNCDALIHSGSTMAIEMHWLNRPSFQFGDVNSLSLPDGNWRIHADSTISRVSPFFLDGKEIGKSILRSEPKSNANADAIRELEMGRYGSMDGKATERAAMLINMAYGKYKAAWPSLSNPVGVPYTLRDYKTVSTLLRCNFCGETFIGLRQEFLNLLSSELRLSRPLLVLKKISCPCCGCIINIRDERNNK